MSVPVPRQPPPPAAESVVAAALAAVEALDGNDRRLLLDHLAQAHPDVVAAGVRWLEGWHAGNRAASRIRRNRDSKQRRDRQRQAATGS